MIPNRIKQNLKTVSPVRHDLGERDYIYVAYIHGINIQLSPDLMRLQASWGVVPESGTRRVCLIKILQGIPTLWSTARKASFRLHLFLGKGCQGTGSILGKSSLPSQAPVPSFPLFVIPRSKLKCEWLMTV